MLARVKDGQPRLRELQDAKHKSKQKQEQAWRLSDWLKNGLSYLFIQQSTK